MERRRLWQFWHETWYKANSKELPPLLSLKIFKPKFPNLPLLESYEGGRPPPKLLARDSSEPCSARKSGSELQKVKGHGARSRFQGPSLAPRDYQDKSFGPGTYGTVLCIYYDTVAWSWAMMEDKLLRFLHLWGSTLSFFLFPSWVACVKLSSFLVSRFVPIYV